VKKILIQNEGNLQLEHTLLDYYFVGK